MSSLNVAIRYANGKNRIYRLLKRLDLRGGNIDTVEIGDAMFYSTDYFRRRKSI